MPAPSLTSPTLHQRLAARAPSPQHRPVMRQRWEDLLFLHWEIDPAPLQNRLPPGLHIDLFEGRAFLGIVPFFMRNIRPTGLPALPWLSHFLELNVRTYVHDDAGIPGVWFYSLDANQPVAVELARRWFHLPYQHAHMQATRLSGPPIHYHCRRHGQTETASYTYPSASKGREAEPGTLEFFLLERYLLYSAKGNRLFRGQVEHLPYRFEPAPKATWSALPLAWEGFAAASSGPMLPPLAARSVEVNAYAVRPLS